MKQSRILYKLIILYLLQQMNESLPYLRIADFILENDYTDYFTLQSALSELLDEELIYQEQLGENSSYRISRAGSESLRLFHEQIPPAIRADMDRYMKINKMLISDESSVSAFYDRTVRGEYLVHCVIKEHRQVLLDLRLCVPEKEQAEAICRGWRRNCQKVYSSLFSLLGSTPDGSDPQLSS